jgi:glycosyltransferase involved in cell wall biosynthesis
MKIAYIDLNYPDHFEDYSTEPKKYGGGRVFAAHAKEWLNYNENEFWIYSNPKSFANLLETERRDRCLSLEDEERQKLREGEHISNIIKDAGKFDLVVHHFTNIWINTEGLKTKQVAWSLGYSEIVNHNAPYVILYNDYQAPRFQSSATKVLKARIGKPTPVFEPREKEDFIFQCTRHTPVFGSIEVAQFCNKHKIQGVFAGPIDSGYPLLDHINNVNTRYIGVITEEQKKNYTARARLYTFLHRWHTPMNLSAIEALGYGTPIAASKVGFWPSLVDDRVNGFLIESEDGLLDAWNNAPKINQYKCWLTAVDYSESRMIAEFEEAFKIVLYA